MRLRQKLERKNKIKKKKFAKLKTWKDDLGKS